MYFLLFLYFLSLYYKFVDNGIAFIVILLFGDIAQW